MNDLPEGWTNPRLEEIAVINPRHPKTLNPSFNVSFVPMPRLSETDWRLKVTEQRNLRDVLKGYTHFADGDVLFAKITPCMENGKAAVATGLANGLGCGTTELHVIRPLDGIDPRYIYHFLHQERFRREAALNFTGSAGQLRVPVSFIQQSCIPLAPPDEQRRIVAKLEEVLIKVEACQKRLAKIPVILKRFRQSVLAAACSGRLTADWRQPEKDEDEWKEATLDALLSEPLANGRSVLTAHRGFPVLRLTCLKKGRVDLAERKVGAWTRKDAEKFLIRELDFLVARGNGSLSLVGRGGLVDGIRDDVAYPDTLIRVRVNSERMSPEFLSVLWESKYIRQQVEAVAHTTAGIFKISQKSIEKFLLQVPPLSEQQEIVRRVEALFKFADQIEARYRKGKVQVDKLTQSILAKAFRGELVPTEAELARRENWD